MKNLFIFLIIALFLSACNLKKVEKIHGVHSLGKKEKKLIVKNSNRNDIISLLGYPSTQSTFDNDIWIYIERRLVRASLIGLGKEKVVINNVLLLEINSKGLLEKKEFFDLQDTKSIKFTEKTTNSNYKKNTFVYDFLSSMRQKINDPLGKRKRE
tara:strand:- start:82 stop:546 length:465 start_codon:yes stop_codon:yes gene_type:complete